MSENLEMVLRSLVDSWKATGAGIANEHKTDMGKGVQIGFQVAAHELELTLDNWVHNEDGIQPLFDKSRWGRK